MKEERKQQYTIGELSKLTGISVTALRYYDRENVLRPEIRNEENGYRYYSTRQVEKSQIIQDLKAFALSLDEIREIMQHKSRRYLEQCLLEKAKETEEEIQCLESMISAY